ncbi:tropomyosin, muscle [Procambarus clarkii]|uniref:tropomyosin, muscle n=1 Tax=Procambarus clarkii TaxID=6728 RepID=UPI0037448AA0
MASEDVANETLHQAIRDEMMSIDEHLKEMRKRRMELANDINGASFFLEDVRSVVSELKGMLLPNTDKEDKSPKECRDVSQQTDDVILTRRKTGKENKASKAKKEEDKIKEEKQEDKINEGKQEDKIKEGDQEDKIKKGKQEDKIKEGDQEDKIKTGQKEQSEENLMHSDKGKAEDKPTLKEGEEESEVDWYNCEEFNVIEEDLLDQQILSASSETRSSMDSTIDLISELAEELLELENSDIVNFLLRFLYGTRQQLDEIYDEVIALDEHEKHLVLERSSLEESDKTLVSESPTKSEDK